MKRIILLIGSLVFGAYIQATDLKDCGFVFRVKRFFKPVENMMLDEKNKELVSYCESNVPKSSIFSFTSEDFTPKGKYLTEIMYLCQHGASVNTDVPYKWRDIKRGVTYSNFKPVYLFIATNNLVATRALIDLGAAIKEPILNGFYPLAFAYTKEMAQLLMEHGAQMEQVERLPVQEWGTDLSKPGQWDLFSAIGYPKYASELIPFYLDKLPGEERKKMAQNILNVLSKKAYEYFSHYAHEEEQFMKKIEYLCVQGAQLDVEAINFWGLEDKEQEKIKKELAIFF